MVFSVAALAAKACFISKPIVVICFSSQALGGMLAPCGKSMVLKSISIADVEAMVEPEVLLRLCAACRRRSYTATYGEARDCRLGMEWV